MAILLQHLWHQAGSCHAAAICAGRPRSLSHNFVWFLWVICEIAIAACDLAEVVGFGPLGLAASFAFRLYGAAISSQSDVLLVSISATKVFRSSSIVITLITISGGCFAVRRLSSSAELAGILGGFVRGPRIAQIRKCCTSVLASSARR